MGHDAEVECPRVIERLEGEQPAPTLEMEKVSDRQDEENSDDPAHGNQQQLVGARRPANAAQVQKRDQRSEACRPGQVRNSGELALDGHRHVNHVNQRQHQVAQEHRPARQEARVRVDAAPHVGVSRSRRRVQCRHASVADRREQHGQGADQDGRNRMAEREVLRHAEEGYGGDGLDQDQAVEHQVPEAEHAAQPWHAGGRRRRGVDLDWR